VFNGAKNKKSGKLMKKVDPKKIASGQRPRYQRRWERTATTTRKEVEKREAISAVKYALVSGQQTICG